MVIKCENCGKDIELEGSLLDGQNVLCPFCDRKFTYRRPSRVELPAAEATEPPKAEEKPRLRIIRPAQQAPAPVSVQDAPARQQMVNSVEARARPPEPVNRKSPGFGGKMLRFIGILIGIYVVLAIAAWCTIPRMMKQSENRQVGVRMAIGKLSADQRILSRRISALTDSMVAKGKPKADAVAAMLGDAEINRLAVAYTGVDLSVQRSSFVSTVTHLREMARLQVEAKFGSPGEKEKQIAKLEARKRRLGLQMRSPTTEASRRSELADIDEQLANLRGENSSEDGAPKAKNDDAGKIKEMQAKSEEEIYKLAAEYQEKTVGALDRVLAEKLGELRDEANKPARLSRIMSPFNIWPINLICKLPTEKEDDKRL